MDIKKTRKLITLLLATLFIATIVSLFYTVFSKIKIDELTLSNVFYHLSQFLALIGFLFISLLIISGDTARFFDRFFGIDRIIKTQRKFAILTYFIVFSHPLFLILSKSSYLKYLIPNFTLLPLAMGAISLYLFAGIMISSLLYKRISYQIWQYIHVLTYILFFFIWYHAFNTGSSVNELPVKILFYTLPVLVVFGIIYRTNYKLQQRKNKFFIKELKRETNDTFTLVIRANKPLSFKPGQFFFLRLEGRRLYARHPFSVSSSPSEKYLSFTIKQSGRFTQEAQNLKEGDEIKVEGPFGNFVINEERADLVFIAGGVGVTPFMSMIKENMNKSVKQNMLLLYGCKKENDVIFRKELDLIKDHWFKKIYVLSREEEKKGDYEIGRINKNILIKYMHGIKNKKFYICGPQSMNHQMLNTLMELGVKKEDIFFEDFFW